MSEFGNPFEGTMPPLPVPNGPGVNPLTNFGEKTVEVPKKRGRPKGWKKPVKAVAAKPTKKAKRGGRRGHPLGSVSADRKAALNMSARKPTKAAAAVYAAVTESGQTPPSFAGSDNVAGLLATLDDVDVKLFFDMYRAMQPREAPDRRTIVAALQASFA